MFALCKQIRKVKDFAQNCCMLTVGGKKVSCYVLLEIHLCLLLLCLLSIMFMFRLRYCLHQNKLHLLVLSLKLEFICCTFFPLITERLIKIKLNAKRARVSCAISLACATVLFQWLPCSRRAHMYNAGFTCFLCLSSRVFAGFIMSMKL